MDQRFERQALLLGPDSIERIRAASVAVFGVGGVGSFATEALARSGIGHITLFDSDVVSISNINRQLIALTSTIGRPKVEVMRDRILDIWPDTIVEVNQVFYSIENADQFDLSKYSYIVDAIDSVSSKILLIERAKAAGVPIISCMGAGNKLDPTQFEIADIYQTSVCPLAKVMRHELRKRGVSSLKVVYSKELPITQGDRQAVREDSGLTTDGATGFVKKTPGSISFVPSVAGLILAGEVIREIAL